MAIETFPFDPAEYLGDPEAQAELIADALATGDAAYVAHALGIVARARGMTQLARDTGMSRESLYKALSPQGNPELATVLRVVQALGFKLTAAAA
ncbi:MAG: putative addiction module antidote protein [Methyloceanibacter sp.]|nr:putative addiction module antidote protein [Methyloceanibacter sp.]